MGIEITLCGALHKKDDREKFTNLLKEISKEQQLKLEDYDTYVIIDICPEGAIICSYEKEFITLVSQTEMAGPGFHAYAVELLEEIQERCQLELELSDPAQYAKLHDFEALRHQHFYPWLTDIRDYVREHQDQDDLCVCWHSDYLPESREGMLITPMGYYQIEDFITKETELLAKEFFLWNEKERNAEYYRNCAYHLLFKECFFTYSSMNEATDSIASSIISYLEAAHEKDPVLALPMDTYQELCTCIGHPSMIHEHSCGSVSGYRQTDIYYKFKNWYLRFPGCAEVFYDEVLEELSVMAPYQNADEPWKWMLKASVVDQKQLVFDPHHDKCQPIEILDLADDRGKVRIFECGEYVEIAAEVHTASEVLSLRYILPDLKRKQQCLLEINDAVLQKKDICEFPFTHA